VPQSEQYPRRANRKVVRLFVLLVLVLARSVFAEPSKQDRDWPAYGHDDSNQKYSPLAQVTARKRSLIEIGLAMALD